MSQMQDFDITYSKPNWCPGCVVPETYIQTNPSIKPITELEKDQRVIASDGMSHFITETMQHEHDGVIYKLVSKYFGSTTLTGEHPVLAVKRKHKNAQNKEYKAQWIEAAELEKGDYLVYPVLQEVRDIQSVALVFEKKKKDTRSKALMQEVMITPSFLRLCGYYIAEGYTHNREIVLTFNTSEIEYVKDVQDAFLHSFGLKTGITIREQKHTIDVIANSSYLAVIFSDWFGKGAMNKKIPDFVMFQEPKLQQEFLKALWRGDGHLNCKTGRASYKTISKTLSEQVKVLLLRQGILPTISKTNAKGMHNVAYSIFTQDSHDLAVLHAIVKGDCDCGIVSTPRKRDLLTAHYAYLPIKAVEKLQYKGPVFNMEVETEHAYVTENAILHNCGDFGIWVSIKNALVELGLEPQDIVVVSGIGCSSKAPYWINVYGFNGLHGRPLPVAQAIKLANNKLTVLSQAGDGDQYDEGGNHLYHGMKRNMDLTHIVHDNQVYGLTVNETTATTEHGMKTRSQPHGSIEYPLNPIQFALASGATYVARGFAGDTRHLIKLITEGVQHKGFAFIDVLQPCVTFNKINTFSYFYKKVYHLEDEQWDTTDRLKAFAKAEEWEERIPIGLFYKADKPVLNEQFPQIKETPLAKQPIDSIDISKLMEELA